MESDPSDNEWERVGGVSMSTLASWWVGCPDKSVAGGAHDDSGMGMRERTVGPWNAPAGSPDSISI